MTGFEKPQGLNPTAIKKTDEFKTWRATINTQHKEQENTLREQSPFSVVCECVSKLSAND
jgi:hypothetical protein